MNKLPNIDILALSKKEKEVLRTLQEGYRTPLDISRNSRVSRTAVYAILKNLKKRGLLVKKVHKGKTSWEIQSTQSISKKISALKNYLTSMGGEEISIDQSDKSVIVYHGQEVVKKLISKIILSHKKERLLGLQGTMADIAWNSFFTKKETNTFNSKIKSNKIITEGIVPEGSFEEQYEQYGDDWARNFEGRSTRVNVIDKKYFNHDGQIWLFRKSIFLVSLSEEMVVEIKSPSLIKMMRSFFGFMQDNSKLIDPNATLRKLMNQK